MSSLQRFRKATPCPICGGYDEASRGEGLGCCGFLSGEYAHCTRQEQTGGLPSKPESDTYAHRLVGECRCGVRHDPTPPDPSPNGHTPTSRIIQIYDYVDETSQLRHQTVRYQPKGFKQRRPNGKGGYLWNLQGITPVLYRLPELLAADHTAPVLVAEGEADVDALRALGYVAICNTMGAQKWRDSYTDVLLDRQVIVIPDNDQDGGAHAHQIGRSFQAKGQIIKILELPGLPEHGDVRDWLAQGHTAEEFAGLLSQALSFALTAERHASSNGDGQGALGTFDTPHSADEVTEASLNGSEWPKLSSTALYSPPERS